jgi:hypothetical protein
MFHVKNLQSIAKKAFESVVYFKHYHFSIHFPTCGAGCVTCTGEKRDLYTFLIGKPERYHTKT